MNAMNEHAESEQRIPTAIPARPVALRVQPAFIPQELKKVRQWVVWRYEYRKGKWTKPPYRAVAKERLPAAVDDPSTWDTFGAALTIFQEVSGYDGIGFVLTANDPFMGVDLDHVVDAKTGVMETWAEQIVARMPGYWELSPSQTGLRHIRRGVLPPDSRRRKGNVEMYCEGRYMTITGFTLGGWVDGAL